MLNTDICLLNGRRGRIQIVGLGFRGKQSALYLLGNHILIWKVGEIGVPSENHWPDASHWQTLSHNVVSNTTRHEQDSNSQL
jgi:hypothetical protein